MRVALFGGSFDPPHFGHLHVARTAAERLGLDRVLFAPTGRQPLKQGGAASFVDRLAMVKLLVREAGFKVSDVDAPREGAPNYTVDTVARVRPLLPDGAALFFLAGADSFLSLAHWREPQKLLLCEERLLDGWVLAARPGFPLGNLRAALPFGFSLSGAEEKAGPVLRHRVEPGGMPLYVLPDLHDPASATEIREALAAGEPTPALPPAVAAYIREKGLYKPVLR